MTRSEPSRSNCPEPRNSHVPIDISNPMRNENPMSPRSEPINPVVEVKDSIDMVTIEHHQLGSIQSYIKDVINNELHHSM